jgi:hypothetical protein
LKKSEAPREHPTRDVLLELVAHESRQGRRKAVLDSGVEGEQVVANDLVKRARFGAAPRMDHSAGLRQA